MDGDYLRFSAGAGLSLVGIGSAPAVVALINRVFAKKQPRDEIYQDADGKSTPEAQAEFSNKLSKFLVIFFASIGLAGSLAVGVLVTQGRGGRNLFLDSWFNAGTWGFFLVQAIAIASSRECNHAYRLGIYSFLAAAVFFASLVMQATRTGEYLMRHDTVLFSFGAFQIFAVVALALASFSIQRRPDVFDDEDRLVDRMYTVSAFSRFNYSWPNSILSLARKQGDLEHKDLGRPNHYVRAKDVSADWKRRAYTSRLWLSIARAHASGFALQWVLTFATSILNFAPQWVILQLLRNLERREPGTPYSLDVWMWVFWLGAAIVVQNWVESYVFWLSWVELTIPIRSQLSALVFEKAMRRKDVKGTEKREKAKETDAASPEEQGEEDEAEALKKSKQGTVNLIGVDAYRVGDFAAYQNLFPGSLFKLIVSLTFLVSLLGWKPLLAGFSTMVAILPVNIYFSKTYAAAQDRLMKVRDEKLAVVTEALQGIRQIKFSALEPEWEKKVGSVRAKELRCLWQVLKSDTALLGCWVASPILLSAISLAVYAYLNDELTPSVAFVSLGVFKALEMTLSVVPELTTDLLDAWVSVNRLEEYLNSPDIQQIAKESDDIAFENASIAWPSDAKLDDGERFVLRDVNIKFPRGELSVISGKTGTGKSLLLAAILGEVDVLAGDLYLPRAPALQERHDSKANKSNWIISNAIAYVAQIPWIENASIKDNILFGLPLDEDRYQETVEVCALKKDLDILSDGEHTEIGANGINLSGGQKWRVTLARAMYSRAGILVFDDIFSAVDAHVGRHIFEKCLTGRLAEGRTRILVTHHVALCEPKTKYMVELGDGKVQCAGLVAELQKNGTLEQIKSHEEQQQDATTAATNTAVNSDGSEDGEDGAEGNTLKRVTSKVVAKKFVEDESREKGAVRKKIYTGYLKASGGWFFWMLALAIFFTNSSLSLIRSWWLKQWTGSDREVSSNMFHGLGTSNMGYSGPSQSSYPYLFGTPQQTMLTGSATMGSTIVAQQAKHGVQFYLGIYIALAMSAAFVGTLRFFYIFTGSVRASRLLFRQMNFAILHAPLRWLDTVPVGRILNRFTADFNVIDSQLANSFTFGFGSFLGLWTVIIAGMFVSPLVVFFALALLVVCAYIALHYLAAARPVKRLESNAKSPVFEQFGSALTGVATIRGFDKTQTYIERIYKRIDDYSTATWHLWLFNRWMGWRMACIGSLFAVFVAVLILASADIGAPLAGFALAFSLEFANSIIWMIRLYANVELNMNAAERIIEYTEIKTETLEGERPPAAWPTNGKIEVDSLVVRYAPDLPPVLKGLTFTVEGRQRIGVVGRTGAGKSSLTLALFRFLEATEGKVLIDGIDISTIRLHDLRSRLAIIPQDPVLFSGTVRSNLDPFDHHTDAELRESLLRVHLISDASGTVTPANAAAGEEASGVSTPSTAKNSNVFANLSSPISEGGLNLSQGQRQLLCLARAIVARPKVMVLDEATSAVDMHTDALIQRSIREEFTDATLVVIAHRLSTISDFDKILVLGEGAVCEYGTPKELWDKGSEGVFRGMCEESGERDKLKDIVFGQKAN
ncbi:multidrug resistance-associated protein 1 [Pyricularia oryzae 70-15]|uniref:Multidrug resistance-associated protein 1 n=3 Tax=Pyricularia oryzae TaxID=318829 RepID=G4N6F4_PYRO7|nr:multidrug resistance-associated protein 1 [Pyricularia oryzae 70-15]EHA49824.1 multidrug resistance-associated protein 1 [Pyricularia oryzae 70-15]ELQ38384.1 multidrug resistance-associated protein 1 [Pyricularia oryzae Y34]KAI7919775.1 multidrug resistance-associated protein 1 [Pyricularia oryzae]